jgi:hypothetical protein
MREGSTWDADGAENMFIEVKDYTCLPSVSMGGLEQGHSIRRGLRQDLPCEGGRRLYEWYWRPLEPSKYAILDSLHPEKPTLKGVGYKL